MIKFFYQIKKLFYYKSIKSVKSPYVYYSLQRFTYKITDIQKVDYPKLIGFLFCGSVAQLVEQRTENPCAGSIPARATLIN